MMLPGFPSMLGGKLEPTYSIRPIGSVNEGTTFNVQVDTENVPDGTVLYLTSTRPEDFSSFQSSATVNSNYTQFLVTLDADETTEGAENVTVALHTGSANGPIVETEAFTINDTSTAPVYGSFLFTSSSSGIYSDIGTENYGFGSGWTIEAWFKPFSTNNDYNTIIGYPWRDSPVLYFRDDRTVTVSGNSLQLSSQEGEFNTNATLNAWNHAALSYDLNGTKLFLNGTLVDSTTARAIDNDHIYVGNNTNGFGASPDFNYEWFDGLIFRPTVWPFGKYSNNFIPDPNFDASGALFSYAMINNVPVESGGNSVTWNNNQLQSSGDRP